jgi:hypothetical protein
VAPRLKSRRQQGGFREKVVMRLSNADVLFPWACEGRAEELSKFRQLARRWRPVAYNRRTLDDYDSLLPLHFGRDTPSESRPPLPRPTWSPWLWVK